MRVSPLNKNVGRSSGALEELEISANAIRHQLEPGRRTTRITTISLSALLLLLPFAFGAVHRTTYLLMVAVISILGVLVAASAATYLITFFRAPEHRLSRQIIMLLVAALLVGTLQYPLFMHTLEHHPLLGMISGLADSESYGDALLLLGTSLLVFFLGRGFLARNERAARRAWVWCASIGVIVALCGLGHWFSDNGQLFGIFAPEHVFLSTRARWPFVNPNNLGQFLLCSLFLLQAETLRSWQGFCDLRRRETRKRHTLFELLAHPFAQRRIAFTLLIALAFFTVLLALVATVSRGSLLGAGIGEALFLILLPSPQRGDANQGAVNSPRRMRTRVLTRMYRSRMVRAIAFLGFCTFAISFFLSGRGAELLEQRFEYGLHATRDDMRWQLYRDSMPLLAEHPWMGIGLGQWPARFTPRMSPVLTGVTPEYLHSDPLQALSELGILGTLPLVLVVVLLLRKFCSQFTLGHSPSREAIALCSTITAILVSSSVDFPFHIPAIQFTISYLLALTTFYLEG